MVRGLLVMEACDPGQVKMLRVARYESLELSVLSAAQKNGEQGTGCNQQHKRASITCMVL